MSNGVSHPANVRGYFGHEGRRTHAGASDSNLLVDGHGWDGAFHVAHNESDGLWCTAPLTLNNLGTQHGHFYNCSISEQPGVADSGLPAGLHNRFNWDPTFPMGSEDSGRKYGHVKSDTPGSPTGTTASNALGIFFANPGPFDVTRAMRFHVEIGRMAGAHTGRWRPHLRRSDTFAMVSQGGIRSVLAGADVWEDQFHDYAAGGPNAALQFMFSGFNEFVMEHDLIIGHHSVEAWEASRGTRVIMLSQRGGMGMNAIAQSFIGAHNDALDNLLRHFHRPPNVNPNFEIDYPVLFRLCSATNDINMTGNDLLDGSAANNTTQGYVNNTIATINRITARWNALAYNPERLFFVITPTPRFEPAFEAARAAYVVAASDLAASLPNVSAFDFSAVTSHAEMIAQQYYNAGGTDFPHISVGGGNELARRELAAFNQAVASLGTSGGSAQKLLMLMGGI